MKAREEAEAALAEQRRKDEELRMKAEEEQVNLISVIFFTLFLHNRVEAETTIFSTLREAGIIRSYFNSYRFKILTARFSLYFCSSCRYKS